MILLAGQAISMTLSKVQKFGMKIEMAFPGDMQAYFGNCPHPPVHENLGSSLDSLSGCLAKLVCIPVELRSLGLGLWWLHPA